MTDQIPADKVREIIARWRDGVNDRGGLILDDLKALLPTPPRPTLADMTPEERAACQWMQADVENRSVRYVIATPYDEDSDTALVSADGEIGWVSPERVTPRPDLPRLEWPEATPTGPNTTAVGTVIESADDPRIAALPDGSILIDRDYDSVTKRSGEWVGIGYIPIPDEGAEFGPWKVMRIGWGADQ